MSEVSEAAVEAAAKALFAMAIPATTGGLSWEEHPESRMKASYRDEARAALEAAAPHMLAECERELADAKRVIALLVLEADGKVAISRRAITEMSDETVIESTQDVINGGWVIRARRPTP